MRKFKLARQTEIMTMYLRFILHKFKCLFVVVINFYNLDKNSN